VARKVRFIHSADLHMGSPLRNVGQVFPGPRSILQEAVYTAFKRIVDAVLRCRVDFLLLSGDIYDQETRSVFANQFLAEQLKRLADEDIPVYIIHGNHDPLGSSREFVDLPENVKVFGFAEVETSEVLGEGGLTIARIMGQSYRTASESRKMYQVFNPPDNDVVNIGMLHTGLNPGSNMYVPCSLSDLKSRDNINYWALGHIHRTGIMHRQEPLVAYPGIPQGRDVGEPGLGGCLMVEAEPGNLLQVSFIPTAPVVWQTISVPIDGPGMALRNIDDLLELILSKGHEILEQGVQPPDGLPLADGETSTVEGYVVRWLISGRGELHQTLSGEEEEAVGVLESRLRELLGNGSPFVWTESVKIHTAPPLPNLEALMREDTIIRSLSEISQEMERDSIKQEEAVRAMGQIWYWEKDHEYSQNEAFPLDNERLQQLLSRARDMVIEKILEGRGGQ